MILLPSFFIVLNWIHLTIIDIVKSADPFECLGTWWAQLQDLCGLPNILPVQNHQRKNILPHYNVTYLRWRFCQFFRMQCDKLSRRMRSYEFCFLVILLLFIYIEIIFNELLLENLVLFVLYVEVLFFIREMFNCVLRSSICAIFTSAKCAHSNLLSKIHQILEQCFTWAATVVNVIVNIIVGFVYLLKRWLFSIYDLEFLNLSSNSKDFNIFFGFCVPLSVID